MWTPDPTWRDRGSDREGVAWGGWGAVGRGPFSPVKCRVDFRAEGNTQTLKSSFNLWASSPPLLLSHYPLLPVRS